MTEHCEEASDLFDFELAREHLYDVLEPLMCKFIADLKHHEENSGDVPVHRGATLGLIIRQIEDMVEDVVTHLYASEVEK